MDAGLAGTAAGLAAFFGAAEEAAGFKAWLPDAAQPSAADLRGRAAVSTGPGARRDAGGRSARVMILQSRPLGQSSEVSTSQPVG